MDEFDNAFDGDETHLELAVALAEVVCGGYEEGGGAEDECGEAGGYARVEGEQREEEL